MPPSKRVPHDGPDDSGREKLKGIQSGTGRGRKTHQLANGISARDIVTSNNAAGSASAAPDQPAQYGVGQLDWNAASSDLLHGYRHLNRLPIPSAFKNPTSHFVLSSHVGIGIGKYSPTMARQKSKRRITQDQLATAVRKHFNALAVSETDVIVEMLYRAKHQDKAFSMKFAPSRKEPVDSGGAGAADGHKGSASRSGPSKAQAR